MPQSVLSPAVDSQDYHDVLSSVVLVSTYRGEIGNGFVIAETESGYLIVTNSHVEYAEDVNILDGSTGKVIGYGFESIPSKAELSDIIANKHFDLVPIKKAEIESRIMYAYEVDGSCSCDNTACEIKTNEK